MSCCLVCTFFVRPTVVHTGPFWNPFSHGINRMIRNPGETPCLPSTIAMPRAPSFWTFGSHPLPLRLNLVCCCRFCVRPYQRREGERAPDVPFLPVVLVFFIDPAGDSENEAGECPSDKPGANPSTKPSTTLFPPFYFYFFV